MLEERSQENNVKSSFFSLSSPYQLDVNSVYRPKYSTLMLDKPFSKPFYSRHDRASMEETNMTANSYDSATPPEGSNSEKHSRDSTPEFNVGSSFPATEDKQNKENFSLSPEVLIKDSISQNEFPSGDNNEDSVENRSQPSSAIENPSSEPRMDAPAEKLDAIPPYVSTPSRVFELSRLNTHCTTVAPSLMELPPSVYLPPFHPLQQVILNPSVAAFAPTPIESLANPLFVSQILPQAQQQQPRKQFPRSKNKRVNNLSQPMFPENGLYRFGVPQNGTDKEYYVMVHVEAGATFSIRTGDQEQQIPGPATVRLVVNNGPPLPMSMQVPPGHLVQQIVDEDGILTHLILTPISPYHQYRLIGPVENAIGNSNLSCPPNSVSPTSRLPPRLFMPGNAGVNVIINPKTALGLALAGPTWPAAAAIAPPFPLQIAPMNLTSSATDVIPATSTMAAEMTIAETNALPQPLVDTRCKPIGGKNEVLEEITGRSQLASVNSSSASARSKKQSSISLNKKKPTSEVEVTKTWTKKLRETSSNDISEKTSSTKPHKYNGGNSSINDNLNSKIPSLLRDDYSSLIVGEIDDKVTMETSLQDPEGIVPSEDTSSSQRTAKPVNVVRPTNGGRPFPAMNGDLTPAEACELKATLSGRMKSQSLNSSTLSFTSTTAVNCTINPSDNVWTARKLAALNSTSEAPNSTSTNMIPISDNNPDQPGKSGVKASKQTASSFVTTKGCTTSTNTTKNTASKSGPSDKRKKAPSKSALGDSAKSKGVSDSGQNEKKIGKKNHHQHQQPNSSSTATNSLATAPTTVAAILDIAEATAATFLPHTTQQAYYSPPPFYTTGGAHPASFFPVPPHATFSPLPTHPPAPPPPHPSHGCFMPTQFHQPPNRSPHQSLPPYLFTTPPAAHPGAAVAAGPPYLSFQLPHHPPPLVPTSPLHPTASGVPNSNSGAPLLGVPPFVTPTTAAVAAVAAAAAAAAAASGVGMSEEERNAIVQILSKIAPPKISEVGCNNVTINISLPDGVSDTSNEENFGSKSPLPSNCKSLEGSAEPVNSKNSIREEKNSKEGSTLEASSTLSSNAKSWSISSSDLRFALYLAERNDNYVCVYVGEVMSILLQDLRPGVHYNTKVCCMYEGLCGVASESAEFVTLTTIPAAPRLPNVFARTKSSLSVRWAVPMDNGSKITSYRLQCATVTKSGGNPSFQACYTGTQRYHKMTHLQPATTYMLRVAATNAHGQGPWSEAVSVTTHGLPPSPPNPPRLLKSGIRRLHLTWEPQTTTSTSSSSPSKPILRYQLEMQEGEARQHFKNIFDGDATAFVVEGLRRCSLYRFRLAASNADGMSHWSDIVAFRTDPDPPSVPKSLRLRGRVRPYQVNLCWLAPDDDGGIPVSAYRLEILMPQLPIALFRKYTNQPSSCKKANEHRPQPSLSDADEIKVAEIRGPICWPWVIAPSNCNTFTSVPPAKYLLQAPKSSIYTLGKVSDIVQLPFRVTSTPDPISIPGDDSIARSGLLDLSDTEIIGDTSCPMAWYAIYEGHCKEVTVCNLTPGQAFHFRVRATSHRNGSNGNTAQFHSRAPSTSTVYWSGASPSPLKISTLAVPPINPPSNLRLLGGAKSNELHLIWDPPTSNGGAPILSYELWQSLIDAVFDSPLKANPVPLVAVGSSGSMKNLHKSPPCSTESSVSSASNSMLTSPEHICQTSDSRLVFAGTENTCKVRELHSGQMFTFRVRARNCTGWSDWSEWTTFATAPSPPAPLDTPPLVKSTSPTSVQVSWEAVEQTNGAPIIEYRVEYHPNAAENSYLIASLKRDGEEETALLPAELDDVVKSRRSNSESYSNDGFQLVHRGIERQFEIHALHPASRIAFRVCAVNAAGISGWSPLGFCILPAAQPDQPSGLALDPGDPSTSSENEACVGGVSMTNARLVWVAPVDNGCPIASYNIELIRYTNSQTTLSTGSNNFDIKYLPLSVQTDDSIEDRLTSIATSPKDENEKGLPNLSTNATNNDFSEDLQGVLRIPEPSDHPSFRSTSVSPSFDIDSSSALSSSISMESGPPRQQHRQYRHHAFIARSIGVCARRLSSAAVKYVRYTLTDLEVGAKYRVRVQALNAVGPSPFSGILHFSTLPPLPTPPTLCCIGTTASSIKLRWSSATPSSTDTSFEREDASLSRPNKLPSTNIKYILEMSKKPESKGWTIIFEGSQTSFKARKLSEATVYYFRVAAVNISGEGPYSEVLHEKTLYSQPPPVEAPQVVEVFNTQCKLQWPAMNSMGQDPLLYQVQLIRVPSGFSSTASDPETLSASGSLTTAESSEGEETITAYRGAEASCTLNNLLSGTNYIARVCAIRCCQPELAENAPKSETVKEILTLPTSSNPTAAKIMLLHGPLSAGTAFTTQPQRRTAIGEFFTSVFTRSRLLTSSGQDRPSSSPRRGGNTFFLNHFTTSALCRVRAVGASIRRSVYSVRGNSPASHRERAQQQMAFLMVVGFVFFTVIFAWFAHQYLLKFADDVSVKWSGGSLDDSSSSARAALYARGRQPLH